MLAGLTESETDETGRGRVGGGGGGGEAAAAAAVAAATDGKGWSPSSFVEWSEENESILVEWGDTAQCYKWFHTKAHLRNARLHALISIPTIVLSTFSGTFSFLSAQQGSGDYFSSQVLKYMPIFIGSVSLFVGVLNTVQQFLHVSELKESHRISNLAWGKLYRNIELELAKAPNERMHAENFIKVNRNEYERLLETSPSISADLVREFKREFAGNPHSPERQRYDQLAKPDICNTFFVSCGEKRFRRVAAAAVNNPLHAVEMVAADPSNNV